MVVSVGEFGRSPERGSRVSNSGFVGGFPARMSSSGSIKPRPSRPAFQAHRLVRLHEAPGWSPSTTLGCFLETPNSLVAKPVHRHRLAVQRSDRCLALRSLVRGSFFPSTKAYGSTRILREASGGRPRDRSTHGACGDSPSSAPPSLRPPARQSE
jgi:hypothetical protein